jgi:acetylornithine deacetylase/succinyl-diaminopimelate desuccinylase family protein
MSQKPAEQEMEDSLRIQALLAALDSTYTQRVLAELIRINSVVGNEGELAAFIHHELTQMGIAAELVEVEPGRPNAYARLQGSSPGKRLHLNGHMDTVPICNGWSVDPFTPLVKDGRMYGLGSCDMKAGLACILNLLRAFRLSAFPFEGELSFSAVIDEEAYSKGAHAVMETDFAACDAVILAEPYFGDSEMPIPLGISGKILYDITVKGKAAHGFRPQQGINAIEDAARIIAALDQLHMTEHPDFGDGNYCTLKIVGGYQVYSVVVPDRCRFEVNRMLVPGETIASALADMHQLIESLGLKSEVEVNVKPPQYESFVMERHQPLMDIFHSVYQQVMGHEPAYTYSKGITDANIFAGAGGIPCLHLGPQRGNVHKADEFVLLSDLAPVCQMYALIAAKFLS